MRAIFLGSLFSGLLLGLLPKFGTDPLKDCFPVEAKGDLHFQADAARFLEDGKPVVEVSLSVPEVGLGAPADTSRIDAILELLNQKGRILGEFHTRLKLPPGPRDPSAGAKFPVPRRWVRLTAPWRGDCAGLRVRLEDTERAKSGLIDRLRGTPRQGEASARLRPERAGTGEPTWLSDLLFIWSACEGSSSSAAGTGLRPVRSRLEPNPYRYYGAYQPVLSVYGERYLPLDQTRLRPGAVLLVRTRILHLPDSLVVHTQTESLSVDTAAQWMIKRFDLTGLEAGSYCTEVALRDPADGGDSMLAMVRGDFQVVWERGNWMLDESQLLAFGRVLLPARSFEDFQLLDRGGMETYLRRLWNRVSTDNPGEENPLEKKFIERVQYATQSFRGSRPGILSDRGLVYVRYGPPDEISQELNPQDQKLLWIVMPQEVDAEGTEDLSALQRQTRRRTPQDNRAYEIWQYTLHGDPLLPDYVNPGQKFGMKFVFVDELGTGDLSLAYTNSPSALH